MAVQLDSRAFKALSSQTRVALLKKLVGKPRSLTALAQELGLSVQATDEHLRKLADAGLVEKDKKNKWAYYRLTPAGQSLVQPDRQPVYLMLAVSLLLFLAAGLSISQNAPSFSAAALPTVQSPAALEKTSAGASAQNDAVMPLAAARATNDANGTGAAPETMQPAFIGEASPDAQSEAERVPATNPTDLTWTGLFGLGGAACLLVAAMWSHRARV